MEPVPSVETRADVEQPKGPISSLIYDVGMNNGDDTAYYLRNGFDVVAIEAHPVLVEHARARFAKEIGDGRLTVLDVGIAEGEGEATFWICPDTSEWSSFDRTIASRGRSQPRAVSVRLRSFGDILAEYGVPYYCKMDIEGNEHLCVDAMTARSRPTFISTELTERSLLDELSSLGYDRFKLVNQQSLAPPNRTLQAIKARAPHPKLTAGLERANGLLRGRLMDRGWYFRRGTSGPLPERTAGPWRTLDEIRRECAWARANLLVGDWWDLHATGAATAPTLD
jgi:FkbM family methyltransferase